jgi:NTE family protein
VTSEEATAVATTADLVLEGGGVKGLGTAGAVMELLESGYSFPRVAGTSAGAVTGALVAAGADARRLRMAMERLRRIPDRARPGVFALSEGFSLFTNSYLYQGKYIRDWLFEELEDLGVITFADLCRHDSADDSNLEPDQHYELVVMATDVTHGRLLRLPWDYRRLYCRDPDEQLVADAVRMSLSIRSTSSPARSPKSPTGRRRSSSTGECSRTSRWRCSTAPTGRSGAGPPSECDSSRTCPPGSARSSRCPAGGCRHRSDS